MYVDAAFYMESESAISKSLGARNLEIQYSQNTDFHFCLHRKFFVSVGRRDMMKLISKVESTYKSRLENKVSACMVLVAPQTSGLSHFFRQNSKFSTTEISGKNIFDALERPRNAKNESQLRSMPRAETL